MSAMAVVIVTLPVTVIMAIHVYTGYTHDKTMIFGNTEMQMLRIAEGLKGPAELFIRQMDRANLQILVEDAAKGADVELIVIYSPNGSVLASNKREWLGKEMTAMHPQELTVRDVAAVRNALDGRYAVYYDPGDMEYCMAMPVEYGDAAQAALHLSLQMSGLEASLAQKAFRDVVILLLLVSSTGATIYWLFYRWFIRRIQAVSSAASKLAGGDMTARAAVQGSDEISRLATSFNLLAGEVTSWRSNLEGMVTDRVKELSALYEVAHIIGQSLELSSIMPKVLNHVLTTLRETKGAVVLVGDDGVALRLMAHQGLSSDGLRQITQFGHGCVGDVLLKNKVIRISAMEEDMPSLPGMEQENIQSVMAVPVSARGSALGVIAVYSDQPDRFIDDDEALLMTIGTQVGVAAENARLYEKTLELARVDGLTGLANRRYFMDTLRKEAERAGRYTAPLSVLIMDLDKFKNFNDTYGHLKGDELLKSFGALLKDSVRLSDSPGRYGGEEFAVILPNTPLKGALMIAERIRSATESLSVPISGEKTAGTTVSIGVAEFAQGETDEKLMAAADAALYRAKQAGRNRLAW